MKNKTVVINQHIHSNSSSWSSSDVYVQIVTNSKELDFTPEPGYIISKKFPMLHNKEISRVNQDSKFMEIYLKSDKTFNYGGFFETSKENTPEFKALVKSYIDKGFSEKVDVPAETDFWKRERQKECKRLKKRGVVLWMGYEAYQGHPEYFQGGFSDEVFNSEQLKKYIGTAKSVHGWIGHGQGRTKYADKLIEAGLRKRGISPAEMYNWLSSGDGRHFGDSLEECTKEEQKEKIEGHLNSMYNKCIIFACPTHGGTLKSSNEIEAEFESLNILLPYGVKYNHKKHMSNLIAAKEKLSQRDTLSPALQYLNDKINEIFVNKV